MFTLDQLKQSMEIIKLAKKEAARAFKIRRIYFRNTHGNVSDIDISGGSASITVTAWCMSEPHNEYHIFPIEYLCMSDEQLHEQFKQDAEQHALKMQQEKEARIQKEKEIQEKKDLEMLAYLSTKYKRENLS